MMRLRVRSFMTPTRIRLELGARIGSVKERHADGEKGQDAVIELPEPHGASDTAETESKVGHGFTLDLE